MTNLRFRVLSKLKPSPAEVKVTLMLKQRHIKFYKEVEFFSCRNPETGCMLRYDFYLPDYGALIEYDGKAYHNSADVKRRDDIKNKFAKANGLRLLRITGYKGMADKIDEFLGSPNKKKKTVIEPTKKKKKGVNVSFIFSNSAEFSKLDAKHKKLVLARESNLKKKFSR